MEQVEGNEHKCPVCYDIPENEIFQCRDGHLICDKCVTKVSNCPLCRVRLGKNKIRNRAMEHMLNIMVFECPHKELGCMEKVPRKELSAHAESCSFKVHVVSICRLIGYNKCYFSVDATNISEQLLPHLEKSHDIGVQEGPNLQINYDGFSAAVTANDRGTIEQVWNPIVVSLNEDNGKPLFIVHTVLNTKDETITWICLQLDSSKATPQYQVKLEIKNETDKVPGLMWIAPCVKATECEVIIQNIPFRIPVSLLAENYTANEVLSVKLTLFKIGSVDYQNSEPRIISNILKKTETAAITRHDSAATTVEDSDEDSDEPSLDRLGAYAVLSMLREMRELQTQIYIPDASDHGNTIFPTVTCDSCRKRPLVGERYKCLQCEDYDLCQTCMQKDRHPHPDHIFGVVKTLEQNQALNNLSLNDTHDGWKIILPGEAPASTTPSTSSGSRLTSFFHRRHSSTTFKDTKCSKCSKKNISQTLFKCLQCYDYDLCATCMDQGHHMQHIFAVIKNQKHNEFIRYMAQARSPATLLA